MITYSDHEQDELQQEVVEEPPQRLIEIVPHQPDLSTQVVACSQASLATAADSTSTVHSPACLLTLLLPTGYRHPYKIDNQYLYKRHKSIPGVTAYGQPDPFSINVRTLKELILLEWRSEWDLKPSSPAYLRLIFLGKLLDDDAPLHQYNLSDTSPNVVHMSVRPTAVDDDNLPKKRQLADLNQTSSPRCCVIL